MAATAESQIGGRRIGVIALALAWFVVLAAIAGVSLWYVLRTQDRQAESTSLVIDTPLESEPGEEISIPPLDLDDTEPPVTTPSATVGVEPPTPPEEASVAEGPGAASMTPDPGDVEDTTPEPEIAPPLQPDNTEPPWLRYGAVLQDLPSGPKIAVILMGLGLDRAVTEAAIDQLPARISLSFSPYAPNLQDWVRRARQLGHEVLLDLPMEPETFPEEDPGPQALMTMLTEEQNLARLEWILARADEVVGLTAALGSRFLGAPDQLRPIFQAMQQKGYLFVDNGVSTAGKVAPLASEVGLVRLASYRFLDQPVTDRKGIDARMIQVEREALAEGHVLALAQPYPTTIEQLAEWAENLHQNGFALLPVTALARLFPAPP